jgi:uncharacterized protein (TIGR00251 family)
MPHLQLTENSDDSTVSFAVKAVPGASRDAIVGLLGDALKIKVAAPPEDGKANKAIRALLAKTLSLPIPQVTIETGQSRPQKRVAISGLTSQQIQSALAPHLTD